MQSENALKSMAWLMEACARAFAGWLILVTYNHEIYTLIAVYLILTGAIIVIVHFIRANK